MKFKTPQKKEAPVEQGVSAVTVEVGESHERIITNLDAFIASVIAPKHPDKHIVWQAKEKIRLKYLGWTALKVDFSKEDVEPVANTEEAEHHGPTPGRTVLAWRDIKRFHVEQQELREKNKRFARFVNQEGTQTQARELNRSMGTPDVYARPLDAREDEN